MSSPETAWKEYLAKELPVITEILSQYHIALLEDQPHTKGERFLIQALTTIGGKKLILLGIDTKTNQKVVIKATRDYQGKEELKHERTCRDLLHKINFSYESFHSPKEIYFIEAKGYVLYVGEFIGQSSSFLERPLAEQFTYALRALKAQEQTRATTAKHIRDIRQVFGTRTSSDYLLMIEGFIKKVTETNSYPESVSLLQEVQGILHVHKERIEQYSNFLTHTDFVPHNFRIKDDILYLLDFSSLRFGNKHEGWARFLNFMTLYNPELESLLQTYIEENRSVEERESLHIMRLFRLAELIAYYVGTLERSSGNLHELNQARIYFWTAVLKAEVAHEKISAVVREQYKETRDQLRSDDEKNRQVGLH
jgi:serine/threonine protein kinase